MHAKEFERYEATRSEIGERQEAETFRVTDLQKPRDSVQKRDPGQHGMNPTRQWALGELRRMVLEALGAHDAAVWLFGSCARGDVRQHSDIDIAILPEDELPVGFFAVLADEIDESTVPYHVDIVDLRHADPALIEEVAREGVKWRD